MNTGHALDTRYNELKQSISTLLTIREALTVNYGLRCRAMLPTHSMCHVEDELSLKRHELEELEHLLHPHGIH